MASVITDVSWLEQRLWVGAIKQGPTWLWMGGGQVDLGLGTSAGDEQYLALHNDDYTFHSYNGSQMFGAFCKEGMF